MKSVLERACHLEACHLAACLLVLAALPGCYGGGRDQQTRLAPAAPADTDARIHPQLWPAQEPVMLRDPDLERRIAALLERMTLEEKVGQIIQADINSVTPDQVRDYNLGSVLNGGNSAPGADNRASPEKWLALADEFWDASTDTRDGGVGIPAIWGTDAVHGHSNIVGATLFPHNIGLGMANDPDLMYEIGRATALEMLATGLDWTFAPTIAVVRNDRWGRTYEGYSEDPRIVAAYAPRIIEGIQGKPGTAEFLGEGRMIATAKHFVGDGGTRGGQDQGDTIASEADFRDIHAAGYPPAVAAGVQTVMASYNSYHGRKMHGYKEMLTDVLVGRMGFDGFVVGDWNGHGQVEACTSASCAASFNAGLDMFMAPDSWEALYEVTLSQVRSGDITTRRLDEAVGRVLRVKFRAGVFDAGRPSSRPHAGDFSLLASPEHRALARQAVRKSLVLLKNENALLPLSPDSHVLLAGDGAHNIGKQSGGWTLNWQGTDNLNEHFPNGMSILEGFNEAMQTGSGSVALSEDGSYTKQPDVAVVVFGEDPYAEFEGDRPNVDYDANDGLELLQRFRADGIPTVSVFLSGRPLWVNPELNASDAFLAAWLPGTEAGGIADLVVGNRDGSGRFDFTGRLSYSWPRTAGQAEVNVGDAQYDPLFAYGYGLSYARGGTVGLLSEVSGLEPVPTR
ncbi:MAG: glycoside hydrolase family 3 protein [Woeseia sp.]